MSVPAAGQQVLVFHPGKQSSPQTAIEDRDLVTSWRCAAPSAARSNDFTSYRDNVAKFLASCDLG